MIIFIDLDLQQAVASFGSSQPAPPIQVKAQDTPTLAIYFVRGNVNYDLGASPGIRFGVFTGNNPNALVQYITFTKVLDAQARVTYVGYPNFNTVQMAAAIGTQPSLSCIAEIRYQTSFGTIARTLDIPLTVMRSLLSEVSQDTTIAAFTVPAVNANVTVRINNTAWLRTGTNIAIGAGAGAYQVVSITNTTDFVAQNLGGTGNAAPATVIPTGTTVGTAPVNVIATYPDASLLELITRKGAASGYAGLNSSAQLLPAAIPVDNTTINLSSGGNLQFASIAASVAANFTTPAANGTVNVTVSSSTSFVVGQWVRIPIAGYYSVTAVPDSTHVTIKNLGDPWNAGSGTTITSGAAILPWSSLGGTGGGGPGQNAFSNTSANFTVPAVLATVPVTMASTAWLGPAGYVVFIAGAGYYAVSSITDATHAILTNLGYLATNAAPGTVINSGAIVTPGGIAGPSSTGTPGANAYDSTSAQFTVPAISGSVPVAIGSTAWLTVGQVVAITGAGSYQVAAITSATVFTATNLNYPGNATAGTVIGSGAHVSPGGLIGPAGAGGAGLNAFTTLLANFTQPAALASVTINVGTTAWMVVGQAVFILGGGYYSVGSITDINHAVVMNLGYSGNAAPGATVASGGGVSPSGLNGAAGANAFTLTTANFTMPTSGSTVTVTVGATAWMAQGQNLFIPGAGYFSVSIVSDATHVVLTNSGTTGNASAGTVIVSGAQVSPAGATGTGTPGPQGATGPPGGVTSLTDAETTAGVTIISSSTGVLKRLLAGTNVTLTPDSPTTGAVTIAATGGGGGGPVLPSARIFDFDDFDSNFVSNPTGLPIGKLGWFGKVAGAGTLTAHSNQGANATDKANGVWSFGGAISGDYASISLGDYTGAAGAKATIVPALGILAIEFRVGIVALPTGTQDLVVKFGLCNNAAAITTITPNDGIYFEYWFGNAITNWQFTTVAGGTPTNTTTGTAAVAGGFHKFQLLTDAGWANIQALYDGVVKATNSAHIPTNSLCPFMVVGNGSAASWPSNVYIDYFFKDYQYTR